MKLQKFLVRCIDFYQKKLSVLKRPSCVFYPTCSTYSRQAIEKYGVAKGVYLSLVRVLRCHPWQKNHMDLLK